MSDVTFCELRNKEVINISDGHRLGRIFDMVITLGSNVLGIIVPGERGIFRGIGGVDSLFIPWSNIKKIGDDVILVEFCATPGDGIRY
jgi:YlmC/YmxH family sporulation protein